MTVRTGVPASHTMAEARARSEGVMETLSSPAEAIRASTASVTRRPAGRVVEVSRQSSSRTASLLDRSTSREVPAEVWAAVGADMRNTPTGQVIDRARRSRAR